MFLLEIQLSFSVLKTLPRTSSECCLSTRQIHSLVSQHPHRATSQVPSNTAFMKQIQQTLDKIRRTLSRDDVHPLLVDNLLHQDFHTAII